MSANQIGKSTETFYPINIRLSGKRALVVGGSHQALVEISRLIDFGCSVDILAPHIVAELRELSITHAGRINIMSRSFAESDIESLKQSRYALILADCSSKDEHERLLAAARQAKVLICLLNDPVNSDYIVPSLIKRGHLKISISTDALSQPLERALVQRIEANFVSDIDNYVLFLSSMAEKLIRAAQEEALSAPGTFASLFKAIAESQEILLALERKNFTEANHLSDELIAATLTSSSDEAAH